MAIDKEEYETIKNISYKALETSNNLSAKDGYTFFAYYFFMISFIIIAYFSLPNTSDLFFKIIFYVSCLSATCIVFILLYLLNKYDKGKEQFISLINIIENEKIDDIFKKHCEDCYFEYYSFKHFSINDYKNLNSIKLILLNFYNLLESMEKKNKK